MNEKEEILKNARINNVLGMFILFFGIIIIISIYFTETLIGQMTNLVAGIVLVAIGGGMIFQSKRKLNQQSE